MTDRQRPLTAALMCMSGMALFGLIDNFMAQAAAVGGLWQFHALRGALAVAILIPLALVLRARLRPLRPGRVAIRTACNAGAMLIYFGSLGFMPIAQVAAGLFTAPFWVVLFGWALFGDRASPARLVWVALGFAGIVLALRPWAEPVTVWTLLPLLAGALYGMGNLLTRHWLSGEGVLSLLAAFFAALGVIGALGALWLWQFPLPVAPGGDGFLTRGWVPAQGVFLTVIVVQAVGSLIGVGLSIKAYQMADAAVVAVAENTLIVFATVWAVILWGQWPDAATTLGLAMITVAGVLIALGGRRV